LGHVWCDFVECSECFLRVGCEEGHIGSV
jgi:hypothetical protein